MSYQYKPSELAGLINTTFEIAPENHLTLLTSDLKEIHKLLKPIVEFLLNKRFEKLMNIMYRIDIEEAMFKRIIGGEFGNDIADALTDAIIQRQIQKLEYRDKYKS